jgi:hypothetical protein
MSDWRISLEAEDAQRSQLLDALHLGEPLDGISDGPREGIGGDGRLFLYSESESDARRALRSIMDAASRHGVRPKSIRVDRWEPERSEWLTPEEASSPADPRKRKDDGTGDWVDAIIRGLTTGW